LLLQEARPMLSASELRRYSRHLSLPQIGLAGQERLKGASVLLVGVGGLGSPSALYLASAGVGRIGLVDDDRVDDSNLQRQVLFGTRDVGRLKVEAAAQRLNDLNPLIEIAPHATRLSSSNAIQLCSEYDLVVDGTDNFATRYLVNDACVLAGKPNLYASVHRFDGQLSMFFPRLDGPCYRCLYPEPPAVGLVQNCAEGGVLGVLPGIMGALQASEAIKWIVERGHSMLGRLLLFDAMSMSFHEIRVRKNLDCPICSSSPTITQLSDMDLSCSSTGSQPEMELADFKAQLASGHQLRIVDVRETWEWDLGNLSELGAELIPLAEIEGLPLSPGDSRQWVVYCKTGQRSARACQILQEQGLANVTSLKGGYKAWMKFQS
jgi:sulfur-carrier protein adenylyltransferase/sulfurtransferase